MVGLDTNIIIRYLTQDDLQQSKQATDFIENELNIDNQGFISLIVLVEIIWVLIRCYKQTKSELLPIINQLLMTKQFKIEQVELAFKALRKWQNGNGDFSDALIAVLAEDNGCSYTLTFDKKAVSFGMRVLG
ncbi:MAG: PIN domain-containing protein [Methylococcaceae bacterium]